MPLDIETGQSAAPPRILIYGIEGIGKSTLGAAAPKPIFIQTEDGLGQIACARFPLASTLGAVTSNLAALATETHDYETVVVDSLDWLERLVWDDVCRRFNVEGIERADGGYGKGYTHALTAWRRVVSQLGVLRDRGMAVILIAHAQIERFADPEVGEYDRYSPRIHKKAAALWVEWCDVVGFATRKMRIEESEGSGFKARAMARPIGADGGERVLRCVGSPACVAKNRFNLPAELPLSWDALMAGLSREV
jgi:hypothetical protein